MSGVSDVSGVSVGPRRTGPPPWAVALGFGVLVVAGLLWAKWAPYWVKVPSVAGSHSLGPSILTGGGPTPPGVSLSAGLRFAGTYFVAIWPALVVGLVLAAAVQVALPSAWLARLFGSGVRGGVRGSALAVPSMMCSCGAAPLTVGLRRRAADRRAAPPRRGPHRDARLLAREPGAQPRRPRLLRLRAAVAVDAAARGRRSRRRRGSGGARAVVERAGDGRRDVGRALGDRARRSSARRSWRSGCRGRSPRRC